MSCFLVFFLLVLTILMFSPILYLRYCKRDFLDPVLLLYLMKELLPGSSPSRIQGNPQHEWRRRVRDSETKLRAESEVHFCTAPLYP